MPDDKPELDYGSDFTIHISDEIASSPTTVGEVVEMLILLQNRMNMQAIATHAILMDDIETYRAKSLEALAIGRDINRRLVDMAGGEVSGD